MQKNSTMPTVKTPAANYAILDGSGPEPATTWLEPVTDGDYQAAHQVAGVDR